MAEMMVSQRAVQKVCERAEQWGTERAAPKVYL